MWSCGCYVRNLHTNSMHLHLFFFRPAFAFALVAEMSSFYCSPW
uniref:Uncharacterized protein n=1 Tax=Arundo donax TaxID=35708 RepID=A0A0A9GNP9_ARUDO